MVDGSWSLGISEEKGLNIVLDCGEQHFEFEIPDGTLIECFFRNRTTEGYEADDLLVKHVIPWMKKVMNEQETIAQDKVNKEVVDANQS